MSHNNSTSAALVFIIAAVTLSTSCTESQTQNPVGGDTSDAQSVETTPREVVYEFTKKYDGAEINVLNSLDAYGMHSQIDREETTGEPLNDAMYGRCRKLEDALDIVFIENALDCGVVESTETQLLLAGDDTYDIMYVATEFNARKLGGEGLLYNLRDFDALQLDEDWWFKSSNDPATINGILYTAVGASNLMQLDSTGIIYFNEDMMTELGLEFPYQLVRDGKWTMDVFNEYIKTGANLNGDSSFAFSEDGSCVYGLATHANNSLQHLYGAGEMLFSIDDGELVFDSESERFFKVVEKAYTALDTSDGGCYNSIGGDSDPGSHMTMFQNGRALFMATELSKTNFFRDMPYSFGILPYPKLDESQESYYSTGGLAFSFAIPITCKDAERSAVVGDALTYLSYTDVLDVWRNTTVEQKGLRNEDSIEMLEIIMDSSVVRPNTLFGVGVDFVSGMRSRVYARDESLASYIASCKTQVLEEIANIK